MIEQLLPQIYTINATFSIEDWAIYSDDTIGTSAEILELVQNGVPVYLIVNMPENEIFTQLIFYLFHINNDVVTFDCSNEYFVDRISFDSNGELITREI